MNAQSFWVGTSFKMNKTLVEALDFARLLAAADEGRDQRVQRFVIPPFTAVREVKAVLQDTSVKVGAQNMHWDDAGAWTGETDRTVGLKVEAAVRHGLTPLICIGESLAQREAGEADAVLKRQVEGALADLQGEAKTKPILLAYEPIWAIGVNGIPATSGYADERQAKIAAVAKSVLGVAVPVLYGGSVNPGNCAELIACPNIDGLFIGRSAWSADGYLDILQRVSRAIPGKAGTGFPSGVA